MDRHVVRLHEALNGARLPHAFGGAFALARYAQPRPTADLDLNVFAAPSEWPRVEEALCGLGAAVGSAAFEGEDQVRVPWEEIELHIFFSIDDLHDTMAAGTREVRIYDTPIPLVSPEHLIVRKTILDRPKDHADVAAIRAVTRVDEGEIERWLARLSS